MEKHFFKVIDIDWGVPSMKLPRETTVEVEGYYPDYSDPIRKALQKEAGADVWPEFRFSEIN